jgi:hypothetical protein
MMVLLRERCQHLFIYFKKHFFDVQCMAWERDFSSHKHPDLFCSTSTCLFRAFPKVLPLQIQGPGHEIDNSTPFNAQVRNEWNCTSIVGRKKETNRAHN